MRIILYTGKGGVGKTSVAASTACLAAKQGKKTLIVSTDPAHSLGDSLDLKLSPEPVEIRKNLWAQEIDTTHEVEKSWGMVQKYLTALFTAKTVKDIGTEELTVFPGMEDLLSLLRILGYYKEGRFDIIVIDCAPTGETLSLLSFPDLFRWWMDKFFDFKRKAMKIMRPLVEPLLGVPAPSDDVLGEIERIYLQLDELRRLFSDRDHTSVRIVVNPEKMVIKEAQRSFTYLNIYDYNVDAIVVNRVIPDDVKDGYFRAWKEAQLKYRGLIEESFSPLPIFSAPLFEQEVVGFEMLARMGASIFGKDDPTAILYRERTQRIEKLDSGYAMSIHMPFTDKGEVQLSQKGEELIVRVGSVKRVLSLPRTLANLIVSSAAFAEGSLRIQFEGGSDGL
jgi:arsenite-transporting ATPase